jgi:hypothetical protein
MCYERRASRQSADEQESRRFWESFRRETAQPPAREPEIWLEGEEKEQEAERPAEAIER